jgi:hypothetical protein
MASSSISPFAWKRGSLRRSSANIHPTDHMSMAVEYVVAPRRISGALKYNIYQGKETRNISSTDRYQSVTTS